MTKPLDDAKEEFYYRWILGRPAVNGFMDGAERRDKFMQDIDRLMAIAAQATETKPNDTRV